MKIVSFGRTQDQWKDLHRKRKDTIQKRQSRIGRPKKRQEFLKNCKNCKIDFLTLRSEALYCSKSCYDLSKKGIPFLSSEFLKIVDKSYMQTEAYKASKRKGNTKDYKIFRRRVHICTETVYANNKDIINPNNHPRTVCGVQGGWQLDHIESVRNCFDKGYTPEHTSRIENLQMLPWKENLMKGKK